MAKKNRSNIQRKNNPNLKPIGHETLANRRNETSQKEDVEDKSQNTFLFTIIGMFAGMLIGLYFDMMALGFGAGMVLGSIVDYTLNHLRKKKLVENEEDLLA